MKEAIGGSWIFGIVIAFVAFFAGYVSLSLNYSKIYRVKDEVVILLQNYNGINNESIKAISKYVNDVGYRNYGNCEPETDSQTACTVGVDSRQVTDNESYNYAKTLNNVNYCVEKIITKDNAAYYQVTLFFKVDLPIVRQLFGMNVQGETAVLVSPEEVNELKYECK